MSPSVGKNTTGQMSCGCPPLSCASLPVARRPHWWIIALDEPTVLHKAWKTDRWTDRETDRRRERQTGGQIETDRWNDRETERRTDRQAGGQTVRTTERERQRGGQTDRWTEVDELKQAE